LVLVLRHKVADADMKGWFEKMEERQCTHTTASLLCHAH